MPFKPKSQSLLYSLYRSDCVFGLNDITVCLVHTSLLHPNRLIIGSGDFTQLSQHIRTPTLWEGEL